MVLAHNLLHLLPDWQRALPDMASWLKPGGHLVTTTAFLSDMPFALRLLAPPLGRTGLIPPIQRVRRDRFEAALRDAGLAVIDHWHPAPRAAHFHIARKA